MSDVSLQALWRDFHIYGVNRISLIFVFIIILNLVELLAAVRLSVHLTLTRALSPRLHLHSKLACHHGVFLKSFR